MPAMQLLMSYICSGQKLQLQLFSEQMLLKTKICITNGCYKKKKNKRRSSETQKTREQEFNDQLDMLFDVAHADALVKMQIPEDRLFLEDQCSVRRMIIGAEDKKFTAKQKCIEQHRMKEED